MRVNEGTEHPELNGSISAYPHRSFHLKSHTCKAVIPSEAAYSITNELRVEGPLGA